MNVFLQTILDMIIQFLCPIAGFSPRFDRKKRLAHCLVGISPFCHGKIMENRRNCRLIGLFLLTFPSQRVVLKNIIPIGSMVLEYLPTKLGHLWGFYVGKYSSTMDPSWDITVL